MGAFGNPLTGASWGVDPNQQQGTQGTATNPLPPNLFSLPQPGFGGQSSAGPLGNPGNFGNPQGGKETDRNVMLNNIIAGQYKNQLAPGFAQLMGQYGSQAGNFFSQLQNLGSPYYRQKQQEGFTQGVQQNQNAGAQTRQDVNRMGYGFSPSGAGVAALAGQQQAGAQSLSEQFLQNLFQNENMQMQGAQGLSSLASMFNPTQLLGGTAAGAPPVISSSFFDNLSSILNSLSPSGQIGPVGVNKSGG